MRILEMTNYSAGICGVWGRVKQEAQLLAEDGHEVMVCTSDRIKGEKGRVVVGEFMGLVRIRRYPALKLGGESFMKWNCFKDAVAFKPEIIIAHSYRHLHTSIALKIGKEVGAPVFLVTHAPFGRDDSRSWVGNLAVWGYDKFVGPKKLAEFRKIAAITHWELPFLEKLGVSIDKTIYIPNGIDDRFFEKKAEVREQASILFLGRVAPIKQLETVIMALPLLANKHTTLEIIGPVEESYGQKLKAIISQQGIASRVHFHPTVEDVESKISALDKASLFILPSKSEGMPQSMIEAMARGKVVVASDTPGSRDLLEDEVNGFLFRNGDVQHCAEILNHVLSLPVKTKEGISEKARQQVEGFAWSKVIAQMEKLWK